MYRSPIITVMGHIDHGKTTLLDRIRNTRVADKEAGQITQSIGSTFVPMSLIKSISKKFRSFESSIPGLLFIDTPGHEAFKCMRERSCKIADIAILVVDILEGFMQQTKECIELLRESKTPFVLAVNKIDKFHGWKSISQSFLENYNYQNENVKIEFEKRFYEIISELEKFNLKGERFDRVSDFTKEIAAVPISAKTGEGIPELLYILAGLSEKFLKRFLLKTENSCGVILEIKDVKGLGKTIDAILIDGKIEVGDYLVTFGKKAKITKIRAILIPKQIQDIRVEKTFENVNFIEASYGVKLLVQDTEDIIAGFEFFLTKDIRKAELIAKDLEKKYSQDFTIKKEEGMILKADTLGALDALKNIFKDFKIKYCDIGEVTKEDILEASINSDIFLRVIIAFNIKSSEEINKIAKENGVKIISSDIIYELFENYMKWKEEKKKELLEKELENVVFPAKIRIIPGYIFRASKPAIVGCEILEGRIKGDYDLFKVEDKKIIELGKIKEIQDKGVNLSIATKGMKVAISITNAVVGRNIFENDILFSNIDENSYATLKKYENILSEEEKKLLEEIKEIKKL
ncbi:MAG: translation initiation factor IF-2 [Candidatus Aenigmatarchaeota archaeon]|nr:translation initiation factor IF-2 [Candidatus Aenigmarchaeota archaeon]